MFLVVWHSRTGAARAMAEAAWTGGQPGAKLMAAQAVQPADLLAAAGYMFACPENLGTMSGEMKEMFDRCYYALLGKVEGRPYATMIAAGSDGRGAQAQLDRIVTGWRLRRVADPLIANLDAQCPQAIAAPKTVPPAIVQQCTDLGAAMCEGLMLGIY